MLNETHGSRERPQFHTHVQIDEVKNEENNYVETCCRLYLRWLNRWNVSNSDEMKMPHKSVILARGRFIMMPCDSQNLVWSAFQCDSTLKMNEKNTPLADRISHLR